MNTYIIYYDLYNPGQNFSKLVNLIKSYPLWARLGGSAYIIGTKDTTVSVRDNLQSVLYNNDKLFVGMIKAPAAWIGIGDEVSQWLRNNLKS